MNSRNYWEENRHTVKYDNYNSNDGFPPAASGELNFVAAASEDEAEFPPGAYLKKGKVSRQDPMSHRIIEKRRRDRMNNCLADLSRLIPPAYLKKGRGRVEKTEIIEMAIRHLKYLQDRVNAGERQGEEFHAGYQEAAGEAVRYLVDVHGYQPPDGLCEQMAAHLHRHCERITKEAAILRQKPPHSLAGSSSETTCSSSGSTSEKPGVIASTLPPAPPLYPDNYEPEHQPEQTYQLMDCDRVEGEAMSNAEPLTLLDGRRTLRTVRKPDYNEDYLHSYKFKNCIERRFSRSQDFEAPCPPDNLSKGREFECDLKERFQRSLEAVEVESNKVVCIQEAEVIARNPAHPHGKVYTHKRRRAAKPVPSTSTSNSGSTEEARDTSPQDTSSDSPAPHQHDYEKPTSPSQFVPVFALNALGKYYVPLHVEFSCLSRHMDARVAHDMMDSRAAHLAVPLHPVTIYANFQPCLNYHVKREPREREWLPV